MGSLPSSLCILFSYDCIYLFLAVLGLHCYIGFSSSSRKQGQLSSCAVQASHCCDFCHSSSCGGAQTGSRAHGLQEFQLPASRSALFIQSWLTVCSPTDCSPPGYSVQGFSRQEYCSGLPFPSPGDLPNPGIEPGL